jgi:hypothetical protein
VQTYIFDLAVQNVAQYRCTSRRSHERSQLPGKVIWSFAWLPRTSPDQNHGGYQSHVSYNRKILSTWSSAIRNLARYFIIFLVGQSVFVRVYYLGLARTTMCWYDGTYSFYGTESHLCTSPNQGKISSVRFGLLTFWFYTQSPAPIKGPGRLQRRASQSIYTKYRLFSLRIFLLSFFSAMP